jgi:hypothetical protein
MQWYMEGGGFSSPIPTNTEFYSMRLVMEGGGFRCPERTNTEFTRITISAVFLWIQNEIRDNYHARNALSSLRDGIRAGKNLKPCLNHVIKGGHVFFT